MTENVLTDDDIQEMADRIVAATHPIKVVPFGSRARGTAQPTSDVDLLIIQPDPVEERWAAIRLRRLLRDFRVPIDIAVVGERFAERYRDIPGSVLYPALKEGRTLYG